MASVFWCQQGRFGPLLVVADAAVDQDRVPRGAQQVALDREQERAGLRVHGARLEPALVLGAQSAGVVSGKNILGSNGETISTARATAMSPIRRPCQALPCGVMGEPPLRLVAAGILNSRCRPGPVAHCPANAPCRAGLRGWNWYAISGRSPAGLGRSSAMPPCVFIHTNHKQYLGALVSVTRCGATRAMPIEFDVKLIEHEDYPFFAQARGQALLRDGDSA